MLIRKVAALETIRVYAIVQRLQQFSKDALHIIMLMTDTALAKARHVFTEHGGMLRTSKAIQLGIHPRTLYALRER